MYVCMCGRLKGDPNHSLAPSYRTLFENVDKTVDSDGYLNKMYVPYNFCMYVCMYVCMYICIYKNFAQMRHINIASFHQLGNVCMYVYVYVYV